MFIFTLLSYYASRDVPVHGLPRYKIIVIFNFWIYAIYSTRAI